MEVVVTDIIQSRMRPSSGLTQTTVVSLLLHAGVLAAIMMMPGILPARQAPRVVMHISLGGSSGPKTDGMTQIGGRTILPAQPASDPKLAKTQLPVLKEEPKMVLPIPDPKMKPKAAPKNTAASKDPQGTTAGRGAEAQPGSTKIDTGAKGQGFGLANAGGGGGDNSRLDAVNFCCMEYIFDMRDRIIQRWNQQQQSTGITLMQYTILRNGTLADIKVEQSSGNLFLDRESERALRNTKFAPLPERFADDHLTVHLEFKYERNR